MRGNHLPKFLTASEQTQLLDIPNPRYWTGERNRLLIELSLKTGLRRSELRNLRWRDIDLESGRLMIREGKGAKDRTLYISNGLFERAESWQARQPENCESRYVFTTRKGDRLNPRYINEMLEKYSKRAGIRHTTPHMLRHSFAVDWLNAGGNIYTLMRFLGHSSLETTEVYLHVSDADLESDLKAFQARKEQ